MSATAIHQKGAAGFEAFRPACQILILHEGFPAYSRAVEVCRRLMEQFANELDFSIKSWDCIELADPNSARHAAKTAGAADIILLSLRRARMPLELNQWLEGSFAARLHKGGALALVFNVPDASPPVLKQLLSRLERLAARLGLDFVPLLAGDEVTGTEISPAPDWPAAAP